MIWVILYRAGIAGVVLAIVVAGAVSVGEILNLTHWPISEGNSAVQFSVQLGLGLLMVCGTILLIPIFPHVVKSGKHDSFDKYLWIFLLVFFPYVVPYIYFRKYLRQVPRQSPEGKEEPGYTNTR